MPASSRLNRVRERMTLPTVRRAVGLLDGRHRSIFVGHGQDFEDLSEYRPGDDVSDIDWKASARSGSPIIKRFQRESNNTLILVVDTGRAMLAQTPSGEVKADLALFVCDVFSYLARMRGDTIALVAGDQERLIQRPPRSGSEHAETMLRQLERALSLTPEADSSAILKEGAPAPASQEKLQISEIPPSDLPRLLNRVVTWYPHRSLVVIVTDEMNPGPESASPLRKLSAMHEVMVVQVDDDDAFRAGAGRTQDVDLDQELPAFLREDTKLIQDVQAATSAKKTEVEALLNRRSIEFVRVRGEDTLIDALADLLRRQHRLGTRRRQ